ncbi:MULTISPECIES: D-mannonate dehydratase ManD [unclassified Mycolicibacterium]|uniref:D-mannonate dehydratase ManD n=1 Tax=unclassified Mycolicibacterium TaxID=2636767 RepID=UPI001F4C283B|nr:D-mannonate dehydratase ManD [Mycolicibacterium sp. YH-1]UNB52062.1 D-galactonate dehydratase family protein [Mycolicibacterium sp. YH-1]
MKITDARVIVSSPGRNFVTLKVVTDDGTSGVGDATLNGRELAVASYLSDHIAPLLIGRDPRQIEDIYQYLYQGAYWRRGPVTMSAIAAVDMALWDIRGKSLGVPVHELLGGASRTGVMVYGHANGSDIDDTVAAVKRYVDMGYRAVRAQTGVPGLSGVYGVGRGELFYEPAAKGWPKEESWSTERYLEVVPELFKRVRAEVGPEIHLLHDGHHRMTPIQAAWLGRRLEDARMFWLEDATPAENQQAFRHLRAHTTTPLAVGEIFNSVHDATTLISEQLIDYIRTPPVRCGGITGARKLAAFAEVYGVKTGFHGATDLSPVAMAAALAVDITIPNFGIQEYMRHTPETDEVFPHAYTFADGYLHPGSAPGLGVDIDETLAAEYPYERAYLPVNRLLDGSIHPW